MVDLEALTVYLGLELGIPIATGAMLERAKRAAVRLLQPAQAFKHKCVPLVVQDRQLIAAIEDPHDFAILDALASITGYRVSRASPPSSASTTTSSATTASHGPRASSGSATRRAATRPPSTPACPRRRCPACRRSRPRRSPRRGPRPRLRSAVLAKQFDDSEALELDAEDLIDTLDADDAAPRRGRAQRRARSTPSAPITAPRPAADAATRCRSRPDAALRDARRRHRSQPASSTSCSASPARPSTPPCMFTVRDQFAFGWKAIGELPGHGPRRAPADPARRAVDVPGRGRAPRRRVPRPARAVDRQRVPLQGAALRRAALRHRRCDRDRQARGQRPLRPRADA